MLRNYNKNTTKAILILSLFLLPILLLSHNTSATTIIKKSQLKRVATFGLKGSWSNQGGALTENYYVYLDCSSHCAKGSHIRIVDRNTCAQVKSLKISHRLSGPYYKWGSNSVTLMNIGDKVGCVKLAGKNSRITSSGCSKPKGGAHLTYQGTAQGTTEYFNKHRFRVAGYHGALIGVWNKKKKVGEWKIPKSAVNGEPEGITVDGATGEVYISFDLKKTKKHPRRIAFYKVDSSVFAKYTGKNITSNPVICKGIGNAKGTPSEPSITPGDSETEEIYKPHTKPQSEYKFDGNIGTNLFGNIQDDGKGCGIYTVLNLIIDILTIGIGIAATIGIAVSGITYLTARGNEERTTKAKRRIYNIVMGVAAYAVLWALLNWVLPDGKFSINNKICKSISLNIDSESLNHS